MPCRPTSPACPTSTARSQFLNTLALLLIATLRRPYTRGYEPWLLDLVASGFAGARTEFGPDLGGHAQSTFPIAARTQRVREHRTSSRRKPDQNRGTKNRMMNNSPGRHFALKRAVDLNYYGSIVKNIDSTILQGLILQIPISIPIIIWICQEWTTPGVNSWGNRRRGSPHELMRKEPTR